MGAICGLYERSGEPAKPDRLAAMDEALAARAPVVAGAISQGPVGLAARRLSAAASADCGPWHDADGRVALVLDGHVLNRAELARELGREVEGAAELIGRGYLVWGLHVFGKLEGAFAVALWDTDQGALLLARDGMGQRPLLYAATPETIDFASNLPALAADKRRKFTLDPAALRLLLAEGHAGPLRTPYAEVRQVAPGTVLAVKGEQIHETRFWQPKRARGFKSLPDAAVAFEPLWTGLIGEHLAGGAAGLLQQDSLGGTMIALALPKEKDLPVYLAAEQWRAEDMQDALSLSRALGLTHQTVAPRAEIASESGFIALVGALDGQVPSPQLLPFQLLCRTASANGPMALADLGASAGFAGDASYRRARLAGRLRLLAPPPLARVLARAARALHAATGEDWVGATARFADALARPRRAAHAAWRVDAAGAELDAVLGPDLKAVAADGAAAALANDGGTAIARAMIADLSYHLPGGVLRQADAMAHLHGLDLRLPFLDRRVLDFALGLAPSLLAPSFGRGGPFLARLLRHGGAPENVWRKPSHPLPVSAARMLRAGLRSLGGRLLDREVDRLAPLLDPPALRRLWRAHATRQADHAALLWNALSLAVWLEQRDR